MTILFIIYYNITIYYEVLFDTHKKQEKQQLRDKICNRKRFRDDQDARTNGVLKITMLIILKLLTGKMTAFP